ncbi:MAG: TonB family protein [Magnetococcus sp. MYC-9]
MNRQQQRSTISLGLALLLHLLLPLTLWWLASYVPPREHPEPVTMVHLITLPKQAETEPDKADAVAEANRNAARSQTADRSAPPPAMPTQPVPAGSEPPSVPVTPEVAVPKPVAKPAQPKPMQKPTPAKPPTPVVDALPSTPSPEPGEEAAQAQTEEPALPESVPAPAPEVRKPSPSKRKAASVPSIQGSLIPSVEALSRWDMNRRFETLSTSRDEEVVDLNTRQVRYASYFAQVKQRIEMSWIYPEEAKREKLSGNVGLVFTILPDGQLLDVHVTRSSHAQILDEAALGAVSKAAPFAAFPEDWTMKKLTIRATFEYIRRGMVWKE